MNTDQNAAKMITRRLEQEQERLGFFERLLAKSESPTIKRGQLLAHCERRGENERVVWWQLALFREAGAVALLFEEEPFYLFDNQRDKLRERILALIKSLPHESLADFRELVGFTEKFIDRVMFLSDLLIQIFAEREKGLYREREDSGRYASFFVEKMFRELDAIHQIVDLNPFQELNEEYEQWLCDRLMDEELLI